jgi:hypothetical protein
MSWRLNNYLSRHEILEHVAIQRELKAAGRYVRMCHFITHQRVGLIESKFDVDLIAKPY